MAKFKVGDRVRTVNSGNGFNVRTPDGVEFIVTEVHPSYHGGTWYRGDPDDVGIWESRLELVSDAPGTETRIGTTVNHYWRPADVSPVTGLNNWGWTYCYNEDVEFYLARGHEVKRVTTTTTKVTEYLESEDD